jgi:hypothetical protein
MAEKRNRDEIPSHPPIPPPPKGQFELTVQAASMVKAGEALPTLTNWGGGRADGSQVVSNARLTNQQRSTIQRAVCSYFLQNKFVCLPPPPTPPPPPPPIASFASYAQQSITPRPPLPHHPPSDAARAQIVHTVTTLLYPSSKTCKHTSHSRTTSFMPSQVRVSLCRQVQKWAQLHVSARRQTTLPSRRSAKLSCLTARRYSHDGKLQPCKFLFGKGKCQHGSTCRFSHDTPSPEALEIVKEQWKNGGIKVAKDTIESCELSAFDAFMSLSR